MDINTGAQQDSRYPAARFNEKGCLQVWVGDALIHLYLRMTQQLPRSKVHLGNQPHKPLYIPLTLIRCTCVINIIGKRVENTVDY
jgi:hypothetical protein